MTFHQDPFRPGSAAKIDGTAGEGPTNEVSSETGGDSNEVPKGTVREVEAWVDGDKNKAQRVLNHENTQDEPRKGLIRKMEEIVGDGSTGSA